MQAIPSSELILNADNSIYHLHLHADQLAENIITVGDPYRVTRITRHFDRVDARIENREFTTHTGELGKRRITVISTGIGTDNIDIVLNELDALANIDLSTRFPKQERQSLNIIRIGTSGSLQEDIPIGTRLVSESAFGYDLLMHFYGRSTAHPETFRLQKHMEFLPRPYFVSGNPELKRHFAERGFAVGNTLTMPGFYAPQGRALRLRNPTAENFHRFAEFRLENGGRLTNLEMETAGIYGLAEILGHRAISLSLLLANRITGDFHPDPEGEMDRFILECIESLPLL